MSVLIFSVISVIDKFSLSVIKVDLQPCQENNIPKVKKGNFIRKNYEQKICLFSRKVSKKTDSLQAFNKAIYR
jgi:hypothetical protein